MNVVDILFVVQTSTESLMLPTPINLIGR